VFYESSQKLDSVYEMILNSAKLPSGADDKAFNKMKADAFRNMDKSSFAPDNMIPILYYGSAAIPNDWFTDDRYWHEYRPEVKETNNSNAITNPVDPAQEGDTIMEFKKATEIDELNNSILIPEVVQEKSIQTGRSSRSGTVKADDTNRESITDRMAKIGRTWIDPQDRITELRDIKLVKKAATTSDPQLYLKYCIVKIERQWFDYSLFTLYRNWYVQGMKEGDLSAFPVDFNLLPEAMIVVRNVSIDASWSVHDAEAIPESAAFGPFSLAGSTWSPSKGSLINKNTQIIGWICSQIPMLPPISDPGPAT
jgi:hypothetical protein